MESIQAVRALAALAHETRLGIFRRLVQAGPSGLPAGALAEALEVPGATLSFHLKELLAAGVVTCRREGRLRIYGPDFPAMDALLGYLTRNCCQGSDGCGPGSPVASAPQRL